MLFETHNLLSVTTELSADPATYSYSAKSKGAGFSMKSTPLHTAVITVNNFVGLIKLQGTLTMYPGESDWVDVVTLKYKDNATSSSISENFIGNWVWIRSAHALTQGSIAVRYNF
jgi:hypothetical protein